LTGDERVSRRVACDDVITGYRAIEVADEASLRAAFSALDRVRVAPSGFVDVTLPIGTLDVQAALSGTHPDGSRVRLSGASDGSSTLRFVNGTNGIIVTEALRLRRLKLLSTIRDADGNRQGVGVGAYTAGRVFIDPVDSSPPESLLVSGFAVGVQAYGSSIIEAASASLSVSDNTHGVEAHTGGVINAFRAVAFDNAVMGFGAFNGILVVREAQAHDNGIYGFYAERGGLIDAFDAVVSDDDGLGFVAIHHAHVFCSRARTQTPFAVQALQGSQVLCTEASLNGSVVVDSASFGNFDNATGENLSITVSDVSNATHLCQDATSKDCADVVCTIDDTSLCEP
jgi:hypothetical protein